VFSVVVPSFNHAAYLASGVVSALRSPLVEEVLLVDDGSRDRSPELIARLAGGPRVRELPGSGQNQGAALRLNQLVEAARCEWVAVLNSDDTFVAGRFEVLRRHCADEVDLVCGHLTIQDANGRVIGTKRGVDEPEYPFPADFDAAAHLARGSLLAPLANQNFIATTSNMVFRRSLHRRVGGFREYRYAHDWDFALRAAVLGRCRMLPHHLTVYRAHASNTISESKNAIREEVRRLFHAFLSDFPEAPRDPEVVRALRGNAYLDPAWLAAQVGPAEA
jgi:GT2 family glycosyltransferase